MDAGAGLESCPTERFETKFHHGKRGFLSDALSPICCPDVEPEFVDTLIHPIKPQARTSNMLIVLQQEDRPILHMMRTHRSHLHAQPFHNLIFCKRPADQSGDLRISPERSRQRQVAARPSIESQSRCT